MKYRIIQFLILLSSFLLFCRLAIAADSRPTWFEHVDLMQVLIGGLFVAVCWFFIRTLQQIDKNQCALFDRMNNLERDFSELKGEHQAITGRCRTETG